MKLEIDEELWYGVSSDEQAEGLAAKSMSARMGRIIGAKPFPAAAQRLSQITQNPACSMDDVVGVLESDPALSARLLRLVNSVGFSLRTACTSVRHAATLVGTEKLNQVASTAAILDMYESGSAETAQLLEHATVVGTLCRYLAFHFGLPPDELFTCGFLHDIGKLMLLDTEGEEYLALLRAEDPQFDTLFVQERKQFGFDHAVLAGHVLAAWHIPHPVPKVVAWHHHVTRAYAESTEISQMVSTLRLADAMSYALEQPDKDKEIQLLAKTEAASYMDISEGQLAAMWEEVRSLTRRARAVFRGEKVDEPEVTLSSRPSAASLRAVAKAKPQEPRILTTSIAPKPKLSERPRKFPCVVCDAPSYAHRCAACHGYACPLHMGNEDEWCQLCQKAYKEEGIPKIRPAVSSALGATAGILLAAAFFGAASAGAQRPLKLMVGPTLILMLLGMLVGVGHRWVRRWWFLRTRPNRASLRPRSVEAVLDTALRHSPQIKEIGLSLAAGAGSSGSDPGISLSQPAFPASPAVPIVEASNQAASFAPPSPAQRDYRFSEPAEARERGLDALPRQNAEPESGGFSEPPERRSEPVYAERRSEPGDEDRPSDPGYRERRSEIPAHRPSRHSVPPQERSWMSNTVRTPRPPSEMPPELSRPASLPPEPMAQVGMVSMPAELTSSILALEQSLSDAPYPLSGNPQRAPKSSRRPSRRASRSPSAPTPYSLEPSAPAVHSSHAVSGGSVSRTSLGTAASASLATASLATASLATASLTAAAPSVSLAAAARAESRRARSQAAPRGSASPAAVAQPALSPPPPAPRSSVVPVTKVDAPNAESPESGWRDVLDVHGTASGW